ncbi:MAG: DNA polymerase III subunit beta [Candidatus Cloacimonetes bacterium]|nr:DNA polymerase III subunit beta [Candidatus Cloacimonadota bacterium]
MLKIYLEGSELKTLIEKASCTMLKKVTMSILGCVILKSENRKLYASCTTMESWLEVNTDYFTSVSDGEIAINSEDFKVITRMTGTVEITEVEENIIVKNGKKTITLHKYNVSDFPNTPTEETTEKLRYTESELLETINNLSVFCDVNENNKMMNVINFNIEESRAEALDGHRIGLKRIDDTETLCSDGNLMIHIMAVTDLKKALNKKSNNIVTIAEGEKYIVITGKNFTYYQRKMQGECFRVSQMLNMDYDFSCNVDAEKALEHFKYYTDNVIAKADRKPILLKIGNDKVITYGRNTRFETSDEMEIKDFFGKELTIGFDPYFLVDALKIADSEEISVKGANPKAPIFITAEKYSFLVLPVNIRSDAMEKYMEKVNVE